MSNRIIVSVMLLFTAACVTQVLNAQGTLVCSGTFEGSQTISLAFAPGANPAPTLGAACAKKGTTTPVGKVVKGTSSVPVFLVSAVVVGAAPTGAGSSGATLVCSGTRANGTAFKFAFAANTSPAPTLGVACVPSGKTMPKGTAVMGTPPKAGTVFAVVLVSGSSTPASGTAAAGGKLVCIGQYTDGSTFTLAFAPGSGPTAGAACEPIGKPTLKGTALVGTALKASMYFAVPTSAPGNTLVCYGTRMDMTPFLLPFAANTSPAPTLGASCVPSGKKMPVGSTVMGPAPKAAAVTAVVLVTPTVPSTPSGTPSGGTASSTTASTTAPVNPPGPPMIANGIANLQNARANLEMAGPNWGPHLANAINYIDQALDVCGVATPDNGMVSSVTTDLPSMMTTGTQQVTKAQTDFKNAKDPWGGRRDEALPFITQALQELSLAATTASTP